MSVALKTEVATLSVSRWPRSARKFENQQNLIRTCAERLPREQRESAMAWGHRMMGEGRAVGAFATLEVATEVAPAFRERGLDVEPMMTLARAMNGTFDYGSKRNGPGDRAWIHRLGDGGGAEVWLEPAGQAPRRLLTREMTR